MGKDKKRRSRQCENVDRTEVDQPSPIDNEELKTTEEEPEEDVMQLVLSEKAVAMNDSAKIRSSMTRQITEASSVAAPGLNTLESSSSAVTPPGAFRVSTTSSQQVEQAAQDVQDDDSESCVFVVPTASLVQEKPPAKDKTRKKDVKIEKEIPVVIAEVTVAAAKDKDSEMKKKLRNKKIFRITVLVGVFLIVVLLIAVLAALLTKPDSGKEKGPHSNDNRPRCDPSIDPLCLGCNPNYDPTCPPPKDGFQSNYPNNGYGQNQNNGYGQNRTKDDFRNSDPNKGGRYLRRHLPKIFD